MSRKKTGTLKTEQGKYKKINSLFNGRRLTSQRPQYLQAQRGAYFLLCILSCTLVQLYPKFIILAVFDDRSVEH